MARLAAAILAGGRGTRLGGAAKPLLTVGGERIIDRQLAVLAPLVDEVVIVANDAALYGGLGHRVIADRRRGAGPLAGLEAALLAVEAEALLLVGGDMPMLSAAALALVLGRAPGADAVVPFASGRAEPLHARYHHRIAEKVSARLERGERALHRLLEDLDVVTVEEAELRAVDPALDTLVNINTPEELARIEARLARR